MTKAKYRYKVYYSTRWFDSNSIIVKAETPKKAKALIDKERENSLGYYGAYRATKQIDNEG